MAKREQAILEVKIEQKSLIADLEKSKRSLIQNKQELQELNKAYKAGSITLEEYASDAVRLEAILKKQSAAYQNTQKAVTGHKSKIDELIKSNSKLGDSFATAAKDMNIAGVNVGGLTSKFASFLTPAGAAVGIATALGAAYARSALGAKDLEFATHQLTAATTLASNAFADFIGASSEDGGGFVSNFLNTFIGKFSKEIAAQSQAMAFFAEDASNLANEELKIRTKVSQRLDENQEKITKMSEDQTSYNEKLKLSNEIIDNLTQNQTDLKKVLGDQLGIIEKQIKIYPNNSALKTESLKKDLEINRITTDTTRKIEAQRRALIDIIDAERKRVKEQADADKTAFSAVKILGDQNERPDSVTTITDTGISADIKIEADRAAMRLSSKKKLADDMDKINKDHAEREAQYRIKSLEIYQQIEETKFAIATDVAGSLAGLFNEQTEAFKIFASAQTVIATYSSAQKSYDSLAGIPFIGPALGFAAAAAAVLAGLKNLGQINNVQFAEGGWTGPGSKYKPAGIVHADEYVTPKQVVNNPMAKPHLQALESMRLRGYADGGFVTNQNTMSAQASLAMVNAIKQLPTPEVSVKEITRTQRRVSVRESTTKIGGKSINRM